MSSDKKYLHVGFLIEDKNLWDVLRILEAHRIGEPKVRHVPPPLLALPAPEQPAKTDKRGYKRHGAVQPKVRAAMGLKRRINATKLARELGEKVNSVHSVMYALKAQGIVKKVGPGTYMRMKLDNPDLMNGASE